MRKNLQPINAYTQLIQQKLGVLNKSTFFVKTNPILRLRSGQVTKWVIKCKLFEIRKIGAFVWFLGQLKKQSQFRMDPRRQIQDARLDFAKQSQFSEDADDCIIIYFKWLWKLISFPVVVEKTKPIYPSGISVSAT